MHCTGHEVDATMRHASNVRHGCDGTGFDEIAGMGNRSVASVS
jgi:hypothetical protein